MATEDTGDVRSADVAPADSSPAVAATTQDAPTDSAPRESEPAAPPLEKTTSSDEYTAEEKASQAALEGHDADIPSNIGYVLDEAGELKRQRSIAEQRSLAGKPSHENGRDLEKGDEKAATEEDKATSSEDEANIVWWDGPDDPTNPLNWPRWRTILNCGLISGLTFITPLASSMFAPGVPQLMEGFKSDSEELAAFVVSVYVLGFAAGPMLFAPLSEIYGRTPIYHICNIGFIGFMVGCALAPTLNALIVFRFFSGLFGACPITNGGGSIADMVPQESRGAAMAIFSIGPLLGPIIGPVAGSFLAGAKGWRWDFWLLVIIAAFLSLAMFIAMKETYAPVLLERKAARLRRETGNPLLRSKLDVGLSPRDYFMRGIVRPFRLLARSPICIIFALYISVVYGFLYLMFTSISEVFEEYYGFADNIVGLVFLGLGVGSMAGVVYFSIASDRSMKKSAAKADAEADAAGRPREGMKPEYRLPPLLYGAFLLPAGLFIYGWTAEYKVQWIVPILGTGIMGVGNIVIFMALQMYLVDAFTIYAASALAANTVVRSVVGAVLPLAGLTMFTNLGVGWGNSVLGFIAVAMVPLPFFIIRYGEYLRKKFEIKNL